MSGIEQVEALAAVVRGKRMSGLWQAILQVQGAVHGVKRDAKNPHFRSNYATIDAVWRTLRQPLQEAGLAVVQLPGKIDNDYVNITTMVVHAESGEQLVNDLWLPLAKHDPQGVGSAITYGCRYSLMAIFSLPPTDDDGDAARHDNPREIVRRAPNNEIVPPLEQALEECADSIAEILRAFENDDPLYALQCWMELSQQHRMALWVAPSKGGPFTTEQRRQLRPGNQEAA